MVSRRPARVLVLPFFLVWTTAAAALSVGVDARGALMATQADGFAAKFQAGGEIGAELVVPLTSWLDGALTISGFTFLPSNTDGGYLYRGFGGNSLGLAFAARTTVASSPAGGVLDAGVIAAAEGSLPSYSQTGLYFYTPEISVAPAAWWTLPGPGDFTLRLALPVNLLLRRDVTFAVSAGVSLAVFLNQRGGR
jgi:hypothetical protein